MFLSTGACAESGKGAAPSGSACATAGTAQVHQTQRRKQEHVTFPCSAGDCMFNYLGHLTSQEDAVCKDKEAAH